MTACVSCQAELASGSNFCAHCGAPVKNSVGDVAADGDFALIRSPASVSEAVVRRGSRARLPVLAGLAVAIAGFVFLAARSPQSSAGQADGEVVVPDASTGFVEEAAAEAAARAGSQAGSQAGAGSDVGDVEGVPRLNTAAEPARSRSQSSVPETTGYRVIATNGQQLLDVNLDSGEVVGRESEYELVGVTDNELYVFDPSIGFKAIPTDDLDAWGRVVFSIPEVQADESRVSTSSLHSAAFRPPSTLILEFNQSLNSPRDHQPLLVHLDAETGRFQSFELESSANQMSISRTQNGLVWAAGAGLFDVSTGQYQKLSDGYPLLLGVNHVIVRECERPDACRYKWLQRSFGEDSTATDVEPLPARPLPDLDGVSWINEIDSQARALILFGGRGPEIYDVGRGRILPRPHRVADDLGSGRFHPPIAMSPDGRWLARVVGRRLAVYDLHNDIDHTVNPGPSIIGSGLVFVPITDD